MKTTVTYNPTINKIFVYIHHEDGSMQTIKLSEQESDHLRQQLLDAELESLRQEET